MFRKALILILLLAVAGCAVPSKNLKIYFFDKEGKPFPVDRELPTIENPVLIAIDQLLKGPNDQETLNGLTTKIPAGTRSIRLEVEGKTAIIDFNSTLHEFSGPSAEAEGMIAQIVYTATSVSGIKEVILKLQGSDQFTLGPDNYVIDHPLQRGDVKI